MRPENQRMKAFLGSHGIVAMPKYIKDGSMRGLWRLYGRPDEQWSDELREKLSALGFLDFQGRALHRFSGNGGLFSVFVMGQRAIARFTDERKRFARLVCGRAVRWRVSAHEMTTAL